MLTHGSHGKFFLVAISGDVLAVLAWYAHLLVAIDYTMGFGKHRYTRYMFRRINKLLARVRSIGAGLFGERLWKLVENPLGLTGLGLLATAIWLLLDYSRPSPVYVLGTVLYVVAWLLFSAAIHRSGFFHSRTMGLGKTIASICVIGIVLCLVFLALPNRLPQQSTISNQPPARHPKEQTSGPSSPSRSDTPVSPQPKVVIPIEELKQLGWSVIVEAKGNTRITFQDASAPLPDMHKSAMCMSALNDRITIGIVQASSLSGISQLDHLTNLIGLSISADVTDLTEIRKLSNIQHLDLEGPIAIQDLESVARLTQLRDLVLSDLHYRPVDIDPLKTLVNLRHLTLMQLTVRDLSAVGFMRSLESLNLTGTPVADLAPLRALGNLSELSIDQRSLAGLSQLEGRHINKLSVVHSEGNANVIDLTAVSHLDIT